MFEIGNKVIVTDTAECGTITDKMYSEGRGIYVYVIKPDDGGRSIMRDEDELQEAPKEESAEYDVVTDVNMQEGMVIVSIIEIKGESRNLVARGHGHLLRRDGLGITQATSYAARRALLSINDNSVNVDKE